MGDDDLLCGMKNVLSALEGKRGPPSTRSNAQSVNGAPSVEITMCSTERSDRDEIFKQQLLQLVKENEPHKYESVEIGDTSHISNEELEDEVKGLFAALRKERPGVPACLQTGQINTTAAGCGSSSGFDSNAGCAD